MRKGTHFIVSAFSCLVLLAGGGSANAQECITPLEWIPKNYISNRDANKNFVDDAIEKKNPNDVISVILELNGCPTDTDIQRLSQNGSVGYRSYFIPVLQIKNITVANAIALGRDNRVALVELEGEFFPTLDVSMAAARIRTSGVYSGANIEDVYPTVTGATVNIAIMDTGVDNEPASVSSGTVHTAFPAWKFINGYDAFLNIETDPDDQWNHGTHVAGIALGTGGSAGTYRGAAPGAGLVDIQIFKPGFSTTDAVILQACDKIIQRKTAWNIGVVNMSFCKYVVSDGSDAISQAVNRIVRAGVVVSAAAGNLGTPFICPPGASDFAMTIASAYDQGTVIRTDDALSSFSSLGPRTSDGDGITDDELKPDVTAYGENIHSAQWNTASGYMDMSGTSMAAPQVAGLAALLMQARPGIDPLNVKHAINTTAEDFGPAGWDIGFGHGIINGFAALQLVSNPVTDLKFNVNCNSGGAWWVSPDLVPSNPSVVESVTNAVVVTVTNAGPATATNFDVRVGVYDYGNPTPDYDICIHHVPSLASGATITLSCPWVPAANGTPPGSVHACLKAYIIYPEDIDFTNNCAQHNVNVRQTHSPAYFNFTVANPTGQSLDMDVRTTPTAVQLEQMGWQMTIDQAAFGMDAYGCPKVLTIGLEPFTQNAPDEVNVTVEVVGNVNGNDLSLGGVALVAQRGIPNEPVVITRLEGVPAISMGKVTMTRTDNIITVGDMDASGTEGVVLQLGEAENWSGTLEAFNTAALPNQAQVSFRGIGSVNGMINTLLGEVQLTKQGNNAILSVDFNTPPSKSVTVYNNGIPVSEPVEITGDIALLPSLTNVAVTPVMRRGQNVLAQVDFDRNLTFTLNSNPPSVVTGDRIEIVNNTAMGLPDYVSSVEVRGRQIPSLSISDQEYGAFGRKFRSFGNPRLEFGNNGQRITAYRFWDRSAVGVAATKLPSVTGYDMEWEPLDIDAVGNGAYLRVGFTGELQNGTPTGALGYVELMKSLDRVLIRADFETFASATQMVEVYNNGSLVGTINNASGIWGKTSDFPIGGGQLIDPPGNPVSHLRWSNPVTFTINGSNYTGDELHVIPVSVSNNVLGLTESWVYGVGFPYLTIVDESLTPIVVSAREEFEPGVQAPFALHQNRPNPFDGQTTFSFELFKDADIRFDIYNSMGNKVISLANSRLGAGTHTLEWNGLDAGNTAVVSGTYFYRLSVTPAGSLTTYTLEKQMVIVK
jgi:subtilisin family serine protease